MRAAHQLRALSENFEVHLVVITLFGGQDETPSDDVLGCCASWKRINVQLPSDVKWSPGRWMSWGRGRLPSAWGAWQRRHQKDLETYFKKSQCSGLWVFRFSLLPWARNWLDQDKVAWIDLDESEANALNSQAELLLGIGQQQAGDRLKNEAEIYRYFEKRFLAPFRRVIVASEVEAERLRNKAGLLSAEVWPNIVVPPPTSIPISHHARKEWRLLFIGSMGHFPNREAVRFAAEEILPRLQKLLELPVILHVAGAGSDAHQAAFTGFKQLRLLGTVPDVTPVYAETDIVIVPIHAGGGTRIKILEAFAHRKAVVSTRLGAEGLDIVPDREYLQADSAEEMATICADLLQDVKKQERLITAAYQYVTTYHSEQSLRDKAVALPGDLKPVA